ncbi:MAG: class I SAM-dependent methyltransferase [Oscillospiraceae bacterium]|nr:class I SAM-dependent methyltransferase [Oscillospiraceae bacterium]
MNGRKYYEAYDDRYKVAHGQGLHWFSGNASPIVAEVIEKYHITPETRSLELGCGEGRDAQNLLNAGFSLLATDISPEAIRFCREKWPDFQEHFQILDCVNGTLNDRFGFIYAVAVIHMLLLDADRDAFYRFIHAHLTDNGIALICSMGDGITQHQSDIHTAFALQERDCEGKRVLVAGTSCRIVNTETFTNELERNQLAIIEMGQTAIPGEFTEMMYAVVKKASL